MKVKSFEDLIVWQEAHKLTLEVYKLTMRFPGAEKYGIVSRLRRSSSAVPANIAEGFGRATTRELLRRDLGYVTRQDCERVSQHCNSVGRLINALGSSLKRRLGSGGESPVTNHSSPVTSTT